jgi:hypothetical protein
MMLPRILALFASGSMLACALVTGDDTAKDEAAASGETYYSVRLDLRKCMFPACGGYWVSRLNVNNTVCANGKKASECYVATIDWSSAGLTQDDINNANATSLIVRGSIATTTSWGRLTASEAWGSNIVDAPSGTFYAVSSSLVADKLNSTSTRTLSSLSGTYGAKAADSLPVIAAGSIDGSASLSVTSFWTQVHHAEPNALSCSVDSDCTFTAFKEPVNDSMKCYCTTCPTTVMNVKTASSNESTWNMFCTEYPPECPAVTCDPAPAVACVSGTCQAI